MDDWEGPPPPLWQRIAWPLGVLAVGAIAAALLLAGPDIAAPPVQAAPPLPTWTPLPASAPAAHIVEPAPPGAFGVVFTGARCPSEMALHVVLRSPSLPGSQAGALTVATGTEREVELPAGTYRMEYWTQVGSRRSPVQRSDVTVRPSAAGATRLEFPGC